LKTSVAIEPDVQEQTPLLNALKKISLHLTSRSMKILRIVFGVSIHGTSRKSI